MTLRPAKPITVTLGTMTERAQAHVNSGRYASMSEVLRAGLRALDREEAALETMLKAKIAEALADTRPSVSSGEVSRGLQARHMQRQSRDA